MKRAIASLATAAFLFGATPVFASSITFDYVVQFSNGVQPNGPAPWLRATITDVGVSAGNDLRVILSTLGLSNQEFISGVYFSLDPTINAANVTAASIVNPNSSFVGLTSGVNCCQADGDGIYDLLLNFGTAGANRLSGGLTSIVDLNLAGGTLNLNNFNFLATPGGGNGPFFSAAHLQGIGQNGSLSTWIADGNGPTGNCIGCAPNPTDIEPVPEPASLFLFGSGLAGLAAKLRKRKSNVGVQL